MAYFDLSEIKALVYNAIGRSTEVSSFSVFKLHVAPDNSGYSVGLLQTDFGQLTERVPVLLNAYQAWAQPANRFSAAEIFSITTFMQRQGLGTSGAVDCGRVVAMT